MFVLGLFRSAKPCPTILFDVVRQAKQMQHANNMSKNNPNIAMMKQKLAALNSTLKQTKTAISQKQREINSLKREKEVAAQLQRTVEKLKGESQVPIFIDCWFHLEVQVHVLSIIVDSVALLFCNSTFQSCPPHTKSPQGPT